MAQPANRILVVFGTRPEAIKLCPLIAAFRHVSTRKVLEVVVCVTGQHREMLDQVLTAFQVRPDYDLNLMQTGQTPTGLTARLLSGLEPVIQEVNPAMIVVQGDTTTAFCGALAAFYARIPIAHVEAGLRTFDRYSPFPEEMNRVFAGYVSTLHFASTEWAAQNLIREGVAPESILVTGNTGIDAVFAVRNAIGRGELTPIVPPLDRSKNLILVTSHRRENFGTGLIQICRALTDLAAREDVQIVWPVHPNPEVQRAVRSTIPNIPNILLLDPLDYVSFVHLMSQAYLLITDSGGVQEEGPSLGKPILVLREKTERPEAVAAGTVKLVGTHRETIVAETTRLLQNPEEYQRMTHLHNPYGDGRASGRIVERIAAYLARSV